MISKFRKVIDSALIAISFILRRSEEITYQIRYYKQPQKGRLSCIGLDKEGNDVWSSWKKIKYFIIGCIFLGFLGCEMFNAYHDTIMFLFRHKKPDVIFIDNSGSTCI